MRKLVLVLLTAALPIVLSACGTTQQVSVPQIVKIPVPVYCQIKPVQKPDLPFDTQAKPSMSLFDKVRLLAAQDETLKAYATELEGAIAGCKAPDTK